MIKNKLISTVIIFLMVVGFTLTLPLTVNATQRNVVEDGFVLINETNYSARGEKSVVRSYEYDIDGNRVKTNAITADGTIYGGWDSEYDSRGNLTRMISFYEENHMDSFYINEFQYDSTNNRIKTIFWNRDGSKRYWVESEYDTLGNVIKSVNYSWQSDEIESWVEYEYDSNGNCVRSLNYNGFSPNQGWRGTLSNRNEYEYDEKGNLIRDSLYYGDTLNFRIEYEYNASRNLTKKLNYSPSGELLYWTEYEYGVPSNYSTATNKVITLTKDWQNNTIPIESYPLDYYLMNNLSTQYNPELAKMAMLFSKNAYDEKLIKESFFNHGFTRIETYNYGKDFNYTKPAFALAEKNIVNGGKIISIVVRGTKSFSDGLTDIGIGLTNDHHGFSNARDSILIELSSFSPEIFSDENITCLIMGHSYGAAVANLLAQSMGDNFGITQDRIFAYTFATPNVTKNGMSLRNPNGKYNNIFNLCNTLDIVTTVPTAVTSQSFTWGKYGRSYWFRLDHPNKKLPHDKLLYFDFMSQLYTPDIKGDLGGYFTGTTTANYISTGILCPVDVDVFNSNDVIIAQFIDNQPIYLNDGENEVILYAIGDEKFIVSNAEKIYTFILTGTSGGTMDYVVQNYDVLTDEIIVSKSFKDVLLVKGKKMTSEINADLNIANLKLFVTDENGEIINEVMTDGSEMTLNSDLNDENGIKINEVMTDGSEVTHNSDLNDENGIKINEVMTDGSEVTLNTYLPVLIVMVIIIFVVLIVSRTKKKGDKI